MTIFSAQLAPAANPEMLVYKSTTCGCCSKWVDHLKATGFTVEVVDVQEAASYRRAHGVPEKLASCHTGVVDGYAVEGNVPAGDIKRLLKERPKAKGLAVPGLQMGSPGREGPAAITTWRSCSTAAALEACSSGTNVGWRSPRCS